MATSEYHRSRTISTRTKAKKDIRENFGLAGTINYIQENGRHEEIEEEEEAERLQKAAGQNNMQPIWDYRRKLRTAANARIIATRKKDWPDVQDMWGNNEKMGRMDIRMLQQGKNPPKAKNRAYT